jgi:hypothetical protein
LRKAGLKAYSEHALEIFYEWENNFFYCAIVSEVFDKTPKHISIKNLEKKFISRFYSVAFT